MENNRELHIPIPFTENELLIDTGIALRYGLKGGGMIKINENLLKNTATRVENSQYLDAFIYPLAKPIISGETYTFSYEGEVGEGVTNIGIYNSGGSVIEFGTLIKNIQAKDNRKFVTFFALDKERSNIDLRVFYPPSTINVLNWMEKVKLELNTEPTMWIPAEADLTPEQMVFLPPYGEYKEIKSVR